MNVTFEHLTKKFPARRGAASGEVIAVDDFDFTIPDGELVGLLGPSGCGKSTALNLISGLLSPTSGHILFGDEDVTSVPVEKRGVGMVFQNYALYPHLTVYQNIIFPLQNLKGKDRPTKEQMKAKADEAARLVQIGQLMERRPSELSGGQQQRVAIARALVKLPRILLLDEPLSNLDARLRLQTREEIRRIQLETGITTIFVTHDQEEAMSISDRIVVMKDGRVQQIGAPQTIYDDPANLFVAQFLGTPPINVFEGRIADGRLYIGDTPVLTVSELSVGPADHPDTQSPENKPVTVAIRPEGYMIDEGGSFSCELHAVEVMGRDVSCVCSHPALKSDSGRFRAIIDATTAPAGGQGIVRFRLKPAKVLLFDPEDGSRIRFKGASSYGTAES